MVDVGQVERRTEMVKTASIEMSGTVGNVITANVADVIKMSELFARSGVMVPPHCRDKPGVCFALCMQAHEWGMPYMGVLNKSYVVNNRGVERIAFESQLVHAVIERNAPLQGRLRFEIVGEGDERRCKVWGTFKGEKDPHVYTSETIAKLHPGHTEKTVDGEKRTYVKGSPLWDDNPEVQLFYSASRQWARLFCPDVLLGAYTPEDQQYPEPIDVTPQVSGLAQRLRDAKAGAGERGFDAAHAARVIEGDVNTGTAEQEAERENSKGSDGEVGGSGGVNPPDGERGAVNEGGSIRSGGSNQADGDKPAGARTAQAEGGKGGAKPKAKGKR